MICPYCNREMELGYLQCRDGVYWCEKRRWVAAVPPAGDGTVRLGEPYGVFSGGDAAEAYKCGHCKKIILDYQE